MKATTETTFAEWLAERAAKNDYSNPIGNLARLVTYSSAAPGDGGFADCEGRLDDLGLVAWPLHRTLREAFAEYRDEQGKEAGGES